MNKIVGLDIGENSVKMAYFVGRELKRTAKLELPDAMVSGGRILSMDAMADFLHDAAKGSGIPLTNAALVVPASEVYTRIITLPAMTEQQLFYNLPYEFRDFLTEEKSKYFFDYAVRRIVNDADGHPKEMELFACAILKTTVEGYRAMLHRAGFRLKFAMPAASAYAALVRAADAPDTCCIIDLGHGAIRVYVLRRGEFTAQRVAELGIGDVVRALAEARGVDEHLAQEYLLGDYENAVHDPAAAELYGRMAAEITKAVNFYNYNHRDETITQVYLCGGGAAIEPLVDAIVQMVNLPIAPVRELPGGVRESAWVFAKAVGCALQNGEERT